jgi:acyl-lipid Delta6-acetylenase / acyl-lipid (9-3)-desaturase
MRLVGALLVAVFWQQCGWLAHDFAHHQVFASRGANDVVTLLVGNVFQGFSLAWWKNGHNRHHSIPNLHESKPGAHDGDPDIDTLPFIAWSRKMAKKVVPGGEISTPLSRFLVKWQMVFYFPILFFARLSWALQSLSFVLKSETSEAAAKAAAAEAEKRKKNGSFGSQWASPPPEG